MLFFININKNDFERKTLEISVRSLLGESLTKAICFLLTLFLTLLKASSSCPRLVLFLAELQHLKFHYPSYEPLMPIYIILN